MQIFGRFWQIWWISKFEKSIFDFCNILTDFLKLLDYFRQILMSFCKHWRTPFRHSWITLNMRSPQLNSRISPKRPKKSLRNSYPMQSTKSTSKRPKYQLHFFHTNTTRKPHSSCENQFQIIIKSTVSTRYHTFSKTEKTPIYWIRS